MSKKILVIMGDGGFGEQVSEALRAQGYDPILVKNGTDGFKQMLESLPHLILLDVVLPEMDGYEVLEKRQNEPLLLKIPLFFISTQGVPINMRKVPEGSVTEFVVSYKADLSEIIAKVNRHFGVSVNVNTEQGSNLSSQSKKKVLWVEDDKLISSILEKKFVSSGFDLAHARNGSEALEMIKTFIPDVIVLDLLLPGMSGFEILQEIKKDERMKNVPAMILSNLSKPSDLEKAKILGANRFLVKAATSLDQIVEEVGTLFPR